MRPNWPKNSQNCSEERLWGCLQLAKMFQAASERCLGTGIIDSVIFKQCFVRNESLYKFWGALEGSQKHLQSFPSPVCENLSDDLKGNLKWHTNKFVCCAATYLGGAKFGALCSARAWFFKNSRPWMSTLRAAKASACKERLASLGQAQAKKHTHAPMSRQSFVMRLVNST